MSAKKEKKDIRKTATYQILRDCIIRHLQNQHHQSQKDQEIDNVDQNSVKEGEKSHD